MDNPPRPLLHDPDNWFHRLFVDEAMLSLLLVLCFVGVAYTDLTSASSLHYWLWMPPIFGLAAMTSEWSRFKREGIEGYRYVGQQLLHWGLVFGAIELVFEIHRLGRLNNDATALTLMTVMALGSALAGVYIGWRFVVLGLFIAFATLLTAELEASMWVLIPIAVAIVAAGLFVSWRDFRRVRST